MKFFIEQIALCPPNPERAINFLKQLGLDEWVKDHVVAGGDVFGSLGWNAADLAFNYQNTRPENKPLELEVLHYTYGPNWMAGRPPMVSHLGMHCTEDELEEFRQKFRVLGVRAALVRRLPGAEHPVLDDHQRVLLVLAGRRERLLDGDSEHHHRICPQVKVTPFAEP